MYKAGFLLFIVEDDDDSPPDIENSSWGELALAQLQNTKSMCWFLVGADLILSKPK